MSRWRSVDTDIRWWDCVGEWSSHMKQNGDVRLSWGACLDRRLLRQSPKEQVQNLWGTSTHLKLEVADFYGELALVFIFNTTWDRFWGSVFTIGVHSPFLLSLQLRALTYFGHCSWDVLHSQWRYFTNTHSDENAAKRSYPPPPLSLYFLIWSLLISQFHPRWYPPMGSQAVVPLQLGAQLDYPPKNREI